MDETFFLTNIAPQVGDGFNRHYWAYLEDWCRRLVRPRDEGMKGTGGFEDVYVFTWVFEGWRWLHGSESLTMSSSST